MRFQRTRAQKGQSAIEYLTTYGWALLAIIIVGAVLVQMGVFNQCQQVTPRFSGQAVAVESWGFTSSSGLSMSLQSINQNINVTNVDIDFDDDGTDDVDDTSYSFVSISAGDTGTLTFSLSSALSSGSCARGDISFTYDVIGGPSGLQASGSGAIGGPVP